MRYSHTKEAVDLRKVHQYNMGKLRLNSKFSMLLAIVLQILAIGIRSSECRADFSTEETFSISLAVSTETAQPLITSAVTDFGELIEAASVDKSGNIFATDFDSLTSIIGQIDISGALASGNTRIEQQIFFKDQSGTSFFNGLRFLPVSSTSKTIKCRALAADVTGHSVVQFVQDGAGEVSSSVFCHDSRIVQPNDIAVAIQSGRVYTSGQNFNSDTVIGDGDLWMCQGSPGFQVFTGPVRAIRLGVFGRTNGIEVSPDEKTLYLSEAFNKGGSVVSNKIWKFQIDQWTGKVSQQTLFVDFEQLDGTGSVDVDGMRTDMDGNLFVTRNGGGEVVKFSPEGEVLTRIKLVGTQVPTNLEFGGPDGKSLFIVGKCVDAAGKGCVDVWNGNSSPGRAFHNLNA